MNRWVTGLDLSLTGAGVVTVKRSAVDHEWRFSKTLVSSEGFPRGYKPTVAEWVHRQTEMVRGVLIVVPVGGLVVIEAPSFGSRFGNPHERSGMWWRIVQYLDAHGSTVVQASPKTRAKYASGSGKADKKQVLAAVRASMPAAGITDHNLADALACSAMGWRWLGDPVEESISPNQLAAWRSVRWPESNAKERAI